MPEPGDIIGNRYQILKFLGKGGFGVTYLAEDIRLEDNYLCVVKHLTNSQAIENFRERTRREASILRDLGSNHPQIPAFLDYLEKEGHIYLVQQYISGVSLKDELAVNPQWNEQQVKILLKDILLILQDVHHANIIHRDIKPSNLIRCDKDGKMVLIDFGVARSYQSTVKQNLTVGLGTQGYSPSEQWVGSPRFCSDIYSVGIIAIQALTGSNPIKEEWERDDKALFSWRDKTQVSDRFADMIDKMTAFHFNERYQSVEEVLQVLEDLLKPPSPKPKPHPNRLKLGLGLGVILLGGLAVTWPFKTVNRPCPVAESESISCAGFIVSKNNFSFQKQKAIEAYRQGNYQQALSLFRQARKEQPNEAEILIYINNLELWLKKIPVYTIAVSLPLSDNNNGADAGQEILKGVAQAQQYINQTKILNGYGLQVIIADDDNNSEKAKQLAEQLGKEPNILAVIGNYPSDVTLETVPVYTQHQLVLLSPTSSSEKLSQISPFFFRTVSSVKVQAQAIADYLDRQNIQTLAIAYNPNSGFSTSLKEEFKKLYKGKIVQTIDNLKDYHFNADKTLNKITQQKAQAVFLIPDGQVSDYAFEHSLDLMVANQNQLKLIGASTMLNPATKNKRQFAEGMILAVTWHPLNSQDPNFPKKAEQLWRGSVSWRTAMGYDATLTLAQAIAKQTSSNFINSMMTKLNPKQKRIDLQKTLKDPKFKAQGVTGEISFNQGDRLQSIVQLVTVAADPCVSGEYIFVPLEKVNQLTCKK